MAGSARAEAPADTAPPRPPGPPVATLEAREHFFQDEIELIARAAPAGQPPRRDGSEDGDRRSGRRPPAPDTAGGGHRGRPPQGTGRGLPSGHGARPVILTLELINHGDREARLEVIDFKSPFGNFAVKPTTIVIPAGGRASADPMISRLEVHDAEPALHLRLIRDGVVEARDTRFQPVADAAAPADIRP